MSKEIAARISLSLQTNSQSFGHGRSAWRRVALVGLPPNSQKRETNQRKSGANELCRVDAPATRRG